MEATGNRTAPDLNGMGANIALNLEQALAGVNLVLRLALHEEEEIESSELACMMQMIARTLEEGRSLFDDYDTAVVHARRPSTRTAG